MKCDLDLDTPLGYHASMTEAQTISTKRRAKKPAAKNVATPRKSTSYAADKQKILTRLRRLEGQVRGVQKMVEADQYCVDVLTQLSAIIAAARTTGLLVLEDHIRGCVLGTCGHGHANQEEILTELTEAIERFTRSAS
jgi:DNA-binding FrmR family transcriptional regulator